jgi:F-type H+-transporting ATPase subunit b
MLQWLTSKIKLVLFLSIAEQILKQKLDNADAQNALLENILNKSNLN